MFSIVFRIKAKLSPTAHKAQQNLTPIFCFNLTSSNFHLQLPSIPWCFISSLNIPSSSLPTAFHVLFLRSEHWRPILTLQVRCPTLTETISSYTELTPELSLTSLHFIFFLVQITIYIDWFLIFVPFLEHKLHKSLNLAWTNAWYSAWP